MSNSKDAWEVDITYNIPKKERRNDGAIIIADGPSRELLFSEPSRAEGKDVALVNRAGIRWEHPAYMWYTYHPEHLHIWWKARKERGYPIEGLEAFYWQKTNVKIPKDLEATRVDKGPRLGSGGTSAFFAATCLLSMGYKEIEMYGVDLREKGYWRARKFWKHLTGAPIIAHSKDAWFQKSSFRWKSPQALIPGMPRPDGRGVV